MHRATDFEIVLVKVTAGARRLVQNGAINKVHLPRVHKLQAGGVGTRSYFLLRFLVL